jgi:anti-sigma-K factor RskA
MNGMDHGRFEELKDAYVLGALSEAERQEFEEYLASHPERQAEVEELGAVAGLLALSPEEHEPPPQLRSRILEAVGGGATHAGEDRRSDHRSAFAWIGELLSVRNVALGVATLLAIGLFIWSMTLWEEVQDLQATQKRTIVLQGSGAAEKVRAEVYTLEDGRAVLMAEDMPPVPEDRTFQIWVIEDDVPKPGGLFDPKGKVVAAAITHPLRGADAIAVTVEPDGGSPKPTSDPMLRGKL